MSLKVFILGVNGFIGSTLVDQILKKKDWIIYGVDLAQDKIQEFLNHDRFHFFQKDITKETQWVDDQIALCDVVLPLVAIATPSLYVKDPLRVFALDFEANLPIVRQCVAHKKRLIFPSTSEVYGMCQDKEFDEESSSFVLGPINKQRWIYSCAKQMLDRVIYAHGIRDGLDYTLFRPFNWVGPKLDNLMARKDGGSRALTQFIGDILFDRQVKLVDGGKQRRTFVDIDEGVDGILRIIENKDGIASQKIYNFGNPKNDYSVAEFLDALLDVWSEIDGYQSIRDEVKILNIPAEEYYGKDYQDAQFRVPSIKRAKADLDWEPKNDLKVILRKTIFYYLDQYNNRKTA